MAIARRRQRLHRGEAPIKLLVLGAGALGGYFGARLLQGGAEVAFLVRPKRAAQLAEQGLVVEARDGIIRRPVTTLAAGAVTAPVDAIFLACKAYDLEAAIEAIAPAVGPGTAILPVLNGIRHIERLVARFGVGAVMGGHTIVHTVLRPDGSIIQPPQNMGATGFGELDGSLSARGEAIRAAFAAGGETVELSPAILAAMWGKFVQFGAIATVATLLRARAGAIAAAPASAGFVDAVLGECAAVATAEGYPPAVERLAVVCGVFAVAGSGYGPSILSDMERGGPTEAEHTIGDLVERAARHGLAVPLLNAARCNLQVYEAARAG